MKAPKGKFTRGSLSKVSTIDAVVYGGGLRGLYTAALLARAGGKVTVLIPQSRCEGGATACLDGAPCDFILDRCEFGQVSRYETLLSVCLHASKPVISSLSVINGRVGHTESSLLVITVILFRCAVVQRHGLMTSLAHLAPTDAC